MRKALRRLEPNYSRELISVTTISDPNHSVTATFSCLDDEGSTEIIRTRYVVGCDDALIAVRRSMGHQLKGEALRQHWGVIDVFDVTDFPNIRHKAAI